MSPAHNKDQKGWKADKITKYKQKSNHQFMVDCAQPVGRGLLDITSFTEFIRKSSILKKEKNSDGLGVSFHVENIQDQLFVFSNKKIKQRKKRRITSLIQKYLNSRELNEQLSLANTSFNSCQMKCCETRNNATPTAAAVHDTRVVVEHAKNCEFAEPKLKGVRTCSRNEMKYILSEIRNCCGWNCEGFPGQQPVYMNQQSLALLQRMNYMVSWSSDGTRYLMYIRGLDEIYMLDVECNLFKISDLHFYKRRDFSMHLSFTLLDGVFVLDVDPVTKQTIPRYIIHDIIMLEDQKVDNIIFSARQLLIDEEIVTARTVAASIGRIDKQKEIFSIRHKQFFPISITPKLLSESFQKHLTHDIDGVIFQPVNEPYRAGPNELLLKWRPPHINLVDFRLRFGGEMHMPNNIGFLHVSGQDEQQPFATIHLTSALRACNNKIITCRWINNAWIYVREQLFNSNPSHLNTAVAVQQWFTNRCKQAQVVGITHVTSTNRTNNMH